MTDVDLRATHLRWAYQLCEQRAEYFERHFATHRAWQSGNRSRTGKDAEALPEPTYTLIVHSFFTGHQSAMSCPFTIFLDFRESKSQILGVVILDSGYTRNVNFQSSCVASSLHEKSVAQWRASGMDSAFIEHLLHEDEGVELDFKREQYPFDGVDESNKSELLKDILAFANAWRRSTAYILIGVDQIRGARGIVIGVSTQLDDAHLQQFVNSKTQRPVTFSYQCCSISGASIGIIEIPVQERPVYTTKTYGKVKQDTVYLRRGSSTAVARPDEVAKMGRPMDSWGSTDSPNLVLDWADVDSRGVLGSSRAVRSLILEPRLPDDTFVRGRSTISSVLDPTLNPDYIQEVIDYVTEHSFFRPLGLRIYNDSEVTGRRVRFVGAIGKSSEIEIREHIAEKPRRYRDLLYTSPENLSLFRPGEVDRSPDLRKHRDGWEFNIEFGDIRPKETLWSDGSIFVGSRTSTGASLQGELLGDNIRHPVSCVLYIRFDVERRAMVVEDIVPYLVEGTVRGS